jgi:hypothetical protein
VHVTRPAAKQEYTVPTEGTNGASVAAERRQVRLAVEKHPRDAVAWIGLAASYDRLRRIDLTDRAYGQAVGIVGPTVEILNNQGICCVVTTSAHTRRSRRRNAGSHHGVLAHARRLDYHHAPTGVDRSQYSIPRGGNRWLRL